MNLEEEKSLLLLMAMTHLGGGGTKLDILNTIEKESWIKLNSHDLNTLKSRNEVRWHNNLAFIRKHLVIAEYVSDIRKGSWYITEKGQLYLQQLYSQAIQCSSFKYISSQAILIIKNNIFFPSSQSEDQNNAVVTNIGEGKKSLHWTTHYERNPELRAKAIKIHGVECMGCGFNFEQKYGLIGRGFIEVHHIKPVSSLCGEVIVNPQSDLVTICSNCHSIIHRRNIEPLSLKDLRNILKNSALP